MEATVLFAIIVLFAICAIAITAAVTNSKKAKQADLLQKTNAELSTRIGELGNEVDSLDEQIWRAKHELEVAAEKIEEAENRLERYRPVMDAELRAAEIERNAYEAAERNRTEASKTLNQARTWLEAAQEKASSALNTAKIQAETMLSEARSKARDIAAEALAVRDKAEEYQRVVQALKNVIDGYGDEYIVPSGSVLDGLAEDYGFTEAGEKLKEARLNTRSMIKQAAAATCDYVEDNRRKTAIAFVIDAFNGKVDSALAKIKADNVGKLRQEIMDAFALVNNNGQAFRNARITKDFLDSSSKNCVGVLS